MSKKTFEYTQISEAPQAIGPYSQAIRYGQFLFASGQIPIDPVTSELTGLNITEQTQQVVKNIDAVLKANHMDASNVIKTTCFLKEMDDFAAFNAVYAEYFTSKPSRSCVAVKTLPKDALCEIEIIAIEL